MDIQEAIEELQHMKRELRKLKFQVSGPLRRTVLVMERMVNKLLKQLGPMSAGL